MIIDWGAIGLGKSFPALINGEDDAIRCQHSRIRRESVQNGVQELLRFFNRGDRLGQIIHQVPLLQHNGPLIGNLRRHTLLFRCKIVGGVSI